MSIKLILLFNPAFCVGFSYRTVLRLDLLLFLW